MGRVGIRVVAGGLIHLVERRQKPVLIGFLAVVLLVGSEIFSLQVDNDPVGLFKLGRSGSHGGQKTLSDGSYAFLLALRPHRPGGFQRPF